jgi:hypothetical protein
MPRFPLDRDSDFVARLFRGEDLVADGERVRAPNPSLPLRTRGASYNNSAECFKLPALRDRNSP